MGGSLGSGFNLPSDLKRLEEKAKQELSTVKRNVFISFAYEDMENINLLRGQAKNEQNDLEFSDYSVKEPFNSENSDYLKRKIAEKIEQASVSIVYISKHTAQSEWVEWEVTKSLKMGKGVIAVYQGEVPPKMPKFITDNNIKAVKWNHQELIDAIEHASNNR